MIPASLLDRRSWLNRWASLAVVLVVAFGGIALPGSAAPLPADFKEAQPGISHYSDRIAAGPLAVQVVRIDRSRKELQFLPMLGHGTRIGLNTLSSQVRLVPRTVGRAVAAINGDFYKTEGDAFPGDPRGLFVSRGNVVSAPAGTATFLIGTNGSPQIVETESAFELTWPGGEVSTLGLNAIDVEAPTILFTAAAGTMPMDQRGAVLVLESAGGKPLSTLPLGGVVEAKVAALRSTGQLLSPDRPWLWVSPSVRSLRGLQPGAVVKMNFATTPALGPVDTAISGGPVLVRGGKVQRVTTNKAGERHPRSAMGWNSTHFFLVTVDGRQPQWSIGVNLPELAAYMRELGCTDAMNLDGGGSTELWMAGRVINRPCYGHERETATSLVVVRTETSVPPSGPSAPATAPGAADKSAAPPRRAVAEP